MTALRCAPLAALLCTLTVLAAAGPLSTPAAADGFIVILPPHPPHLPPPPFPPPRPIPRPDWDALFPLAVRNHDVEVTVKDQHAVTEVDQVFHNPRPHQVEGTYMFPVPEGATVSGFSMWMGDKEVEAELLDADRAREIYTSIVRRMKDPALLEYAGRGMFKARIFPIPANGEVRVRLRYQQLLTADGGLVSYTYPLNTERFSAKPLKRCTIDVRVEDPVTTVFSPSHRVDVVRREDGSARLSWEASDVLPDKDFQLFYQRRDRAQRLVGMSLLSHREAGEDDGTFLLLLDPDAATEEIIPQPKDVVFVLDTSGSMAGDKIGQARAALRYCLNALDTKDRFALVDFATEPRRFRDALVPASRAVVDAALEHVGQLTARGGTNLEGALRAALGYRGADDRPFMVVLVTDGEPTIGVTVPEDIEKAVRAARERRDNGDSTRLFCLGVGAQLNVALLDRLAQQNRGTRSYIGPRESIEVKVSSFFDKVSWPVLSDVEVEVPGARVTDIHPRPLPDLFKGGEVAILGRYASPGTRVIKVRGTIAGERVEILHEAGFAEGPRAAFLPRMHAVRKVAYLLDQMRLHGESKELREEVVRLAKKHGIVTPYTSYLVVEDERRAAQARPGGARHAAARAIEELRRRADGYARAERDAERAVAGGAKAGADAAGASEALRRMAEEAAAPAASEPARAAGEAMRQRGRFSGGAAADPEGEGRELADTMRELVRVVRGRTFYRIDGVWVDARSRPGADVERVAYLSDAYFELLEERPEVAPFLAMGRRVRLVVGDRAIEVTDD
jgi:Ca-activated chloride channel family protein